MSDGIGKNIKCTKCFRHYLLKIDDRSFRKNGLYFIADPNKTEYNSFRCKCGCVIEENYEELN